MAGIASVQKGLVDSVGSIDPVPERYHEFTRRIPKSEMRAIDVKMTELKPADVGRFVLAMRAPQDLEEHTALIRDTDAPYFALYALRQKRLSVGEVATICRFHFALKHEGAALKSIADNRAYARSMVLTSGSFAREARIEEELGIEVPEGRVDDYLNFVMRKTSVIDSCFVVFPDDQPMPEMVNGVVTKKPSLSQRIYQVGLSLLGFSDELEERPLRIAASFGMMACAVGLLTPYPCLPNPVLGLSSLEDIRLGQDMDVRDMAIPFPGVLIPKEADGFAADDMGFTYHDFSHALAVSHILDSHRKAYMQISRLLEASGEESALVGAFADIDFPLYARLNHPSHIVTEGEYTRAFWEASFYEIQGSIQRQLNKLEPKQIFSIIKKAADQHLLGGLASIQELYKEKLQRAEQMGQTDEAEEFRQHLSWISA